MVKTRNPPKERKSGDLKRKASSASISLEDPESLSPLAEAVRRVSPFVSITPTPPPSRGGNGGPSPRKRILVEDRLEVRPVASTSKLVQHHHHLQPVPSTSKEPKEIVTVFSDSEDEELDLMEKRLMAESEDLEEIVADVEIVAAAAPVGERVAYIHVSEGCEEDLEAQLKGAKNLDIQILEEESLPDIDESDMIHGLDHTGTSRDYVDDRHRCTVQCPVGCQGHLRPNEIVIYESFKWKGRLRGRRRYKGRIIYNTRYQDSCGSSSNLSTGSGHPPGSGGLVGGSGASGGVAGNGSNGASAIAAAGGRETRRSSRFRSSAGSASEAATSASVHNTRSSSSGRGTSHRSSVNSSLNSSSVSGGVGGGSQGNSSGGGGRTKSSKSSRRERGEDRGTPYDSSSSSNLHRGSRRHHRNNHHSSSTGSSASNMGGNVSSKFSNLKHSNRDGNGRPGTCSKELPYMHRIPPRLEMLMDMPPPSKEVQLKHAWNQDDRSYNIFVKEDDKLTFHRHPVAQSTDCIRAKVGYERGLHLFEITWSTRQRGTHAVVGVSTAEAPIHSVGYQSLVGNNEHSWGWDLGRNKVYHNSKVNPGVTYPPNLKHDETFVVPDKFLVMLDMDEGTLGFVVDGKYLGPAFRGLRGKKLYLMVSAVWGHCEITMKYLGGLDPEPLPLMDLCRRVIRQTINKERIEQGKIAELNLPKTIKDYLEYKDRRALHSVVTDVS